MRPHQFEAPELGDNLICFVAHVGQLPGLQCQLVYLSLLFQLLLTSDVGILDLQAVLQVALPNQDPNLQAAPRRRLMFKVSGTPSLKSAADHGSF
jgi:hypothetical protein